MDLFKSEIWDGLLERVKAFNSIQQKDPEEAIKIAMELAETYMDIASEKEVSPEKRLDFVEKSMNWKNIAENLKQR